MNKAANTGRARIYGVAGLLTAALGASTVAVLVESGDDSPSDEARQAAAAPPIPVRPAGRPIARQQAPVAAPQAKPVKRPARVAKVSHKPRAKVKAKVAPKTVKAVAAAHYRAPVAWAEVIKAAEVPDRPAPPVTPPKKSTKDHSVLDAAERAVDHAQRHVTAAEGELKKAKHELANARKKLTERTKTGEGGEAGQREPFVRDPATGKPKLDPAVKSALAKQLATAIVAKAALQQRR